MGAEEPGLPGSRVGFALLDSIVSLRAAAQDSRRTTAHAGRTHGVHPLAYGTAQQATGAKRGSPGPDGDDPHKLRHELIEVFEAVQTSLSGNQSILYDTNNVNSWFQAMQAGDKEYADFLVRRMTPDYCVAFEAWIKTDPIHNLKAPLGPRYMPQWSDPLAEKAAQLDEQASAAFELGVTSRETGENYVRLTVILAAVLFLIAVGQRFKIRAVRIAVTVTASVFLVHAIVIAHSYKRA